MFRVARLFLALCLPVVGSSLWSPSVLARDSAQKSTQDETLAVYTLEEAVRMAVESNPDVEAEKHGLDAAESARKAARGAFGPTVSSSYVYTRYDKDRPERNERNAYTAGITVSQPLFTGFHLLNAYQKASLQQDYQALQLEQSRLSIAVQVQEQFLAYLAAQEDIRSTRQSLERARAQLELAKANYAVGQRPRLDVLQAELEAARTEAALIQNENSRDICRARLNTLLNLPVNAPVEYVGELDQLPFSLSLEQGLERAFRLRPDLRMARLAVEMAEKDLGMAQSTFYPQIEATLDWNSTGRDLRAAGSRYSPTDYSQWQTGIAARWVLFSSGTRWFTTKEARAQVAALKAQAQSAVNAAAYEVKSCLLNVQDSRRVIDVARRAVTSARESYENARMRYELQEGTNLDLLTAQADLAQAELSYISARSGYLTALSKLYAAMGELRPDLRQ